MDPFATAEEMRAALREGTVSARGLAEQAIARIDAVDGPLHAFRTVRRERALEEADAVQARLDAGDDAPLLGVPIAMKDDTDQVGEATTYGTAAYEGTAHEDAEITRRIKEAGMVIVGRTLLPELAIHPFTESMTWGATRNPWAPDRTPGGSSGGSAAAVAAGVVPIGTAGDGGGSIRLPAGNCHLFGLKPQRGRVSLKPDAEHWTGLSVKGCVTRTVLDTARFLDAVAGPAPGDAHPVSMPDRPFAEAVGEDPGRLRIAVSTRPHQPGRVHPDVVAGVREVAELLRNLGHVVEERDPPRVFLAPAFVPRYAAGLKQDVSRLPHPERLEAGTRAQLRLLKPLGDRALERARAQELAIVEKVRPLFEDYDVLLTPVAPHLPAKVGRYPGRGALRTLNGNAWTVNFTAPWNITGQPAASVPAGFTRGNLPRAAQLVGRPNAEATLLSLAAQLELRVHWDGRRPPLPA
jgi:amidase